MFGNNPILAPVKSDGKNLDVQEIFATFQGEGIFTGFPAVFIRLGGCNLACKFCDTEFDSYKKLSLEEILFKARNLAAENGTIKLAVITGGEPLRQNIVPLCKSLIKEGFTVQIETNGTLFQDLPKKVNIVCSPKNPNGKYYPIRPDLLQKISAFKFLISADNKNYNFVPEVGQTKNKIPVYLQPMDEYDQKKNQKNRQLVLKLARENGCRLSLQTHKLWGID
ncbi:MAG: 7-carboxy-7-deazaguanine synthase QueE [Rickettsiaceae bacterium]|jgi:organic radical activating enzyme|nr:7-carboxy-7-deazaguanine synthase QueE [Rickettsiaceae bacterium]